MSWDLLREQRPELAAQAKTQFCVHGLGMGFLATVRKDGGPRVHPICPVLRDDGIFGLLLPGPKLEDLRRDPRYALHSDTVPPPDHDDAFYVTGRVEILDDAGLWREVADQQLAETKQEPYDGFDELTLVEFGVSRCLLTLTRARDGLPKGHTTWRAR